jgi:hypothetical protein
MAEHVQMLKATTVSEECAASNLMDRDAMRKAAGATETLVPTYLPTYLPH